MVLRVGLFSPTTRNYALGVLVVVYTFNFIVDKSYLYCEL